MVANPAPAKEGDGGEQKTGPVSDDDHVLLTLQLVRQKFDRMYVQDVSKM